MNDAATTRNPIATAALATAICGLFAQPVLTSVMVVLLMRAIRHHTVAQLFIHIVFVLPQILGLVSVVLAHVARFKIKNNPTMAGKAAATAGMIIGYATLAHAASAWFSGPLLSRMMPDF